MLFKPNHNYKETKFNFNQDVVHNNSINNSVNYKGPFIPNIINYNNNNNFMNKSHLFNNNSFHMNQYLNNFNRQINSIPNYPKLINHINNYNNYNAQYISNNYNYNKEKVELDCICDKQYYSSKEELKQCILCNKYQHKICINAAQYISPYLCFNCQFKNNHFYLKYEKTVLPAQEFIYKKKWEDDPSFLKEGTKTFNFHLNLKECYELFNNIKNNNNDENTSYYLAILCLTNNGRPFHLGFPDNINITINDKKFYNTEGKGFKRPLLLAIENNKFYIPKRRHLITSDKYEIPNAADFFYDKNNYMQKVTISFANNLENYRGSEFEFVDIRHYLIFIGIFQEIKIPQMSLLKGCKNLSECFQIFKPFYEEKVMKLKWNKIGSFVSMENELLNMNMISEVSNQKIICPVRGLFCQHSEIMDYGECCGYITSNNQVYKCFKCNKPLNIMYIDDMSEKIFNKYKNENYSQIYFSNKFKFIKGEKIEDNNPKVKNNRQSENEEDESLSESFFKYYENRNDNDEYNNINNENNKNNINEIIEINSDTESMIMTHNNDISPANPALDNYDMNLGINNENESQNVYNDSSMNNVNNNSNDNSNNVIVINNLDKSEDEIQPSENTDNNIINNGKDITDNNNKNDEIITLIEDDEDEKENQDDINNKIFEKEKVINNNELNQQNQIGKSSNNSDSDISSNNKINQDIIHNENSMKDFQEINQQKNKENIFNMNSSKENDKLINGNKNEFLNKKRNKVLNKINKKKDKEKESTETDIHSPRKRIFRRIEKSPALKANNKSKEKEEKKNEKINLNHLKPNNIKLISHNSSSNGMTYNEQNNSNYINVSSYEDTINTREKSNKKNKNYIIKNKSVIKNKIRNSEKTSNSVSNNTQNNSVFSEYDSKENNKNKRKKKKILKMNKEKDEDMDKINIESDNDDYILINDKLEKNKNNESRIVENKEDDYETIYIDRKDLIEIRPYYEYKDKQREINEEEEEFLNDFDIFENELLNNNQMEFLNYDYYNIQRKLREYCSIRYQDDEIFNGNKTFFNKFK